MVSVEDPFLPDVNLNRALAAENEQPLKQALLTAHREPRADAARVAAAFSAAATYGERFERRGIEPFELFRSEFGQNSCKFQERSPENQKNSGNFNIF